MLECSLLNLIVNSTSYEGRRVSFEQRDVSQIAQRRADPAGREESLEYLKPGAAATVCGCCRLCRIDPVLSPDCAQALVVQLTPVQARAYASRWPWCGVHFTRHP